MYCILLDYLGKKIVFLMLWHCSSKMFILVKVNIYVLMKHIFSALQIHDGSLLSIEEE